MTVTADQARMLAELARASRPTGARRWDTPGIVAAIKQVADRQLAEVVMAFIRGASDRDCETPAGVVTCPRYWRESAAVTGFVPHPFDRQGSCSVCSKPEAECRARWRDDHDYEPLERAAARKGAVDIHRTVAALKDELAPTAPPPEQRTLDDRLAAIPPERRDPMLDDLRVRLAHETETAAAGTTTRGDE